MDNQNILISGASVAGPALAYWLRRYGFRPTVVERAPELRGGGYAVDFRGPAHLSVLARMGLLEQIRAQQTHLKTTAYVRADGSAAASMPAGIFAGDVEILRGDLGRILYQATRDGTEYLFGDSITGLQQQPGGVRVTFCRAAPRVFDLVIGADGLHSAVRRLAFSDQPGAVQDLGLYVSIFSVSGPSGSIIPGCCTARQAARHRCSAPGSPGGRWPSSSSPRTAGPRPGPGPLTGIRRPSRPSWPGPSTGWAGTCRSCWPSCRRRTTSTSTRSAVHLDRWSAGRTALIGDAGYAAGPGGNGTGTAVIAAYVLAGELAAAGGDHRAAFARYEQLLRPYVARGQKQARGGRDFLAPRTERDIRRRDRFFRVLRHLPAGKLIRYVSTRTAAAITLPDYPGGSA
jgi:2-polyprenyl-6-methoxyphenol hydroxylase-like FAD-dependent oxidoreductase